VKTVSPACHEFHANLLYSDDGLDPCFACDSAVKEAEGSKQAGFHIDGEHWTARLSYQDSNIVHPGETTPMGTTWRIETMREYRIKVKRRSDEDDTGQQNFTAHLAPRWPDMRGRRDDGTTVKIPVPDGFGEGVNVRVKGSNIDFRRYTDLLQRAAGVLGIASRYFENPHPYSNVQDAERYVRVHRDASGPVHARDGPIVQMAHLLEHDRRGYRKLVQNDTDEKNRTLPGYYHTATLDAHRVREAFPDHHLPKEVKHYYAREAAALDENNPLAHPKIGASLQVSLLDEDETVRLRDVDRLIEELDQTVLSVLAEAGLDVAPSGSGPFFADPYFEPQVSHDRPDPVSLNLTRVRQQQESVVVKHLADGLSPVQWESLETLVTDGGEIAPADIADAHGRHVESVRQALRKMDDLVHREYAEVHLRSEYVAEMVHEAVQEARDATKRAAETTARAMEAAERGLNETMSSFIAWASRHGVDVDDSREARMCLRFGRPDSREARRAIREGFEVWKDAGMPAERYRSAQVRFENGVASAWRYLNPG
jgi:hypothetical protein